MRKKGKRHEFSSHQDLAELKDKYLRAAAELENVKKRTAKERAEFAKFAAKEVFLDLLSVVDNFERALAHVPKNESEDGWMVGIIHIHKQLVEVLARHQVEKVAAKEGDEFDESRHNAIERKPHPEISKGKIIKVINHAYTMHGEVIRPASVIVSAGK